VGMYVLGTGERLPVIGESGVAVGETVQLDSVVVGG
jgi:hypothetical protein